MGKRIFGVKVIGPNASIRWVTLISAMVGVPITAVSVGVTRSIRLAQHGVETATSGVLSFVADLVGTPLTGTATAIEIAWLSFEIDLLTLGLWAFPVAVLGSVVVVAGILFGVRILG